MFNLEVSFLYFLNIWPKLHANEHYWVIWDILYVYRTGAWPKHEKLIYSYNGVLPSVRIVLV